MHCHKFRNTFGFLCYVRAKEEGGLPCAKVLYSMVDAVSHQSPVGVRSQASPCGIYGEKKGGIVTRVSVTTLRFSYQYFL
jgi:hypothetical protein